MSYTVQDLLKLFDLEQIEHNIYRGQNRDIGSGRIFGGQVLAQALVAARRTVEEDRDAHSVHGYFILPGDLKAPVVYFVERLRDGKSFTTRRVTAIQHGRAIFNMSASFQVREPGPEHQIQAPEAAPPESLRPELDMIREAAHQIPEPIRPVLTQDRPIDFRPETPREPVGSGKHPPLRRIWLRAIGQIPDDLLLHQAVLAYASDYGLLGTALQPHGLSIRTPNLQVASLDHAIWFHRPFRADEWLLYVMDSPAAAGARGFVRGSFFTRDGVLVASVAQEGLMRLRVGPGQGEGGGEGRG
ncbi:MAG TPA: acyl-CoA thioesterase II [Longimicrobiales bacterium]